ncbi:hypothetical protein [Limnoglobus roseus]|uniref:Uncharacterized protein n=1 Tax=Limnoglobus roseus TaxID=2598579 RepID=A0A5C1ADZ1_9BACT|nr:hypothetical protein [Limnoglobus roseus]QEL16930.1 hypothetical protein PX52LOC_03906 [Limnoglobus roseus]
MDHRDSLTLPAEGKPVVKKPAPKVDPRLLGTWRSDRRRTFRHFKPKAGCSPRSLRLFKGLFGKLVIRWDRRTCHTDLDGFCQAVRYEVVASDAVSVVVRLREGLTGEERLQHIHFDGDHYWVALGGGSLCEFFRRVPPGE